MLHMNVSGGSIAPCFPGTCADDDPKSIVFFLMSVWIDWKECEIWIGAFCWFKSMAPKLKRPCAALKIPAVRDDLSVRWTRQHEGDPWSNAEIIAELKEWAECLLSCSSNNWQRNHVRSYIRFRCRSCSKDCKWHGIATYDQSSKELVVKATPKDFHGDLARWLGQVQTRLPQAY